MKKSGLLFIAIVALLNVSWAQGYVTGQGAVVAKELQLETFNEIGLAVVGKVFVSKGSTQKVSVEGQANIIDNLKTEVQNGEWSISFKSKTKNYESLVFRITLPEVEGLSIAGSGSIIGQDAFEGLENLKLSIAGSGDIEFAGSSKKMVVSIAGSGTVKGADLNVDDCKIEIAGNGDCTIGDADALSVSIAGSGDVKYKGNPKLSTSIAGSGRVSRM